MSAGGNGENREPMFGGVAEALVLADSAMIVSVSARLSERILSNHRRQNNLSTYQRQPHESYHPDGAHYDEGRR
jgi:hypothetical protein